MLFSYLKLSVPLILIIFLGINDSLSSNHKTSSNNKENVSRRRKDSVKSSQPVVRPGKVQHSPIFWGLGGGRRRRNRGLVRRVPFGRTIGGGILGGIGGGGGGGIGGIGGVGGVGGIVNSVSRGISRSIRRVSCSLKGINCRRRGRRGSKCDLQN